MSGGRYCSHRTAYCLFKAVIVLGWLLTEKVLLTRIFSYLSRLLGCKRGYAKFNICLDQRFQINVDVTCVRVLFIHLFNIDSLLQVSEHQGFVYWTGGYSCVPRCGQEAIADTGESSHWGGEGGAWAQESEGWSWNPRSALSARVSWLLSGSNEIINSEMFYSVHYCLLGFLRWKIWKSA